MQVLQVELDIAVDPVEVGRARRWARARLAGCGIPPDSALAQTAVLLISELVTNAVVHAAAPARLRLSLPASPEAGPLPVRVEVRDASVRAPRRCLPCDEDTGGRGLELVECLADRWGWQPDDGGKRIWCELDADGAATVEAAAAQAPPAAAPLSV